MHEVVEHSFIVEFPGTLTPEQCRAILTGFDALGLDEHGPTALGIVDDKRCCHAPLDHALKKDEQTFTAVHEAVMAGVNAYRKEWDILAKVPVLASGLLVQKYDKGDGYYKPHVDAGHPSVFDRLLAVLVYLNDVNEGGETEFPYFGARVKPESGKMVVFPVNWPHLHAGRTPASSDKYVLSAFIRLDHGQRQKAPITPGSWSAQIS